MSLLCMHRMQNITYLYLHIYTFYFYAYGSNMQGCMMPVVMCNGCMRVCCICMVQRCLVPCYITD